MNIVRSLLLILWLASASGCTGSQDKTVTSSPLPDLPVALTNAAVTAFEHDTVHRIYVFGGLEAGKGHSDITLRSFGYDLAGNEWSETIPLPDTLGKIAAAASQIRDKIYIAGGYHVFADGHERSSDRLHIYDPITNEYQNDGQPIPVAIDDHVQAVYRDSLLYLVSGWHDTANVNLVQIYDPASDSWQEGTPLPRSAGSYVFGASGIIVGDTLYMAGGAGNRVDKNFPLQGYFTKGYIHPENPARIDWIQTADPIAAVYRSVAILSGSKIYWAGGAADSYNYNGISYKGNAVEPRGQALVYDMQSGLLSVDSGFPAGVMDLRGAAAFGNGKTYIAGGMLKGQVVSDSLLSLEF
ncbi:MAG: hypothetical protein WBB45_05435 [Cyclobacteriaceae bacterium]